MVLLALLCGSCARERDGAAGASSTGAPSLRLFLTIPGTKPNGELGFRFGSPRDVDGDGIAEIAAGARFTDLEHSQMGTVGVWSSAGGGELARWEGPVQDALFGQSVLIVPDIDGDGGPDVVASAPNGRHEGIQRGAVRAFSARSARTLWSALGEPDEALGWHLALAPDRNGDGIEDILAGAPGNGARGMVYVLDGRTGATLSALASSDEEDQFGWYVAAAADLDGDGLGDLLVGAPSASRDGAPRSGAAHALSAAGGRRIHAWRGREANAQLGEVVAGLADLDGDGVGDVGVSATYHPNLVKEPGRVGEVAVFSGATGREIFLFRGRDPGELYGRMIAPAGDVDGDGAGDIAIGAPWWKAGDRARAGRFEVRSGRSGQVLLAEEGDRAGMWLGWHIAPGEDLGAARERGLVVSAIRSEENGLAGAGSLRVYVVGR